MVTAIAGAENCAAVLSKQFGIPVETAANRRDASIALRRREFSIVVIDESLVELREDGADSLLKHCGLAIPLEMNFAISGCGRLVREVRAALSRREREQEVALTAAASSIERELRETVAGLLLQAQLALAEPGVSAQLSERLGMILEVAVNLRQKLDGPRLIKVETEKPGKLVAARPVRAQQNPAAAALPV
jgi:hypothetical protein